MKASSTPRNHKEYFAAQPTTVATRLKKIQEIVTRAAPDAVEVISYGMPAFKVHGRILIYFAAHTNHIGIYPAPRAVPEFRDELADYGGGRGTVQFPHAEKFPAGLVGRIVKHKANELCEKYARPKKTPASRKATSKTATRRSR